MLHIELENRDKEIEKLRKWMSTQPLHPQLAKQIILYLNSWKCRVPKPRNLPVQFLLCKAILQQDRLGWKQFIEGFWSKHWNECQAEYFKAINRPNSSTLLLSKVQRRIWQIAWEMWFHRNQHLHSNSSSTPAVEQLPTRKLHKNGI